MLYYLENNFQFQQKMEHLQLILQSKKRKKEKERIKEEMNERNKE